MTDPADVTDPTDVTDPAEATDLAERWLEPRLAHVPPALAAAVRDIVARDSRALSTEDIPDFLARTALRELDEALATPEGRERGALRLLAADAILTYAFEAATSLGTDALALAERLGLNGEIGARLRAARQPEPRTPPPGAE